MFIYQPYEIHLMKKFIIILVLALVVPGFVLAQAGNVDVGKMSEKSQSEKAADYKACKESIEKKEAQAKDARASGNHGAAAEVCKGLLDEKMACAAYTVDDSFSSGDNFKDWQDKITDNMFMCCESAIEDLKKQSANAKTSKEKAAIEDKIMEKVLECQQFSQSGVVDERRTPPIGRIGGSNDPWSVAGFDAWVKGCEEKIKDAQEKIDNAKTEAERQQAVNKKMEVIYECLQFGYSGLVSEGSDNVTQEVDNLWKKALITTLMDCQERLKNAKTQEEREKVLKECTEKVDEIPNNVKGTKLKENPWEALINLGNFDENTKKALKAACESRISDIETKVASTSMQRWEKENLEKKKELIETGCVGKLGVDVDRITIDKINKFADTYNKNLDKVPSVIKSFFSTLKINFILRSSKGEKIVLLSMMNGEITFTQLVKEPQKAEMTMSMRQTTLDEITASKDIAGTFLKAIVDGRINRDINSPALLIGFGAIDGVSRSQNPPTFVVKPGETKQVTYMGSPATLTTNARGTTYIVPANQNHVTFVNQYGVDYGYGSARSQGYMSYNTNRYSQNAGIYTQPPTYIQTVVQRQPVYAPAYTGMGFVSSYQPTGVLYMGAARGASMSGTFSYSIGR